MRKAQLFLAALPHRRSWTSTFARRTYNDGKYQAPPFEMLETNKAGDDNGGSGDNSSLAERQLNRNRP